MLNYWIFTVKDDEHGTPGIEIYNQRMSDAFWGLEKNVANRAYIKNGDYAVFYLAGKEEQRFLGTCILASSYYEMGKKEKERLVHGPSFRPSYGVRLKEIHVWDMPKSIYPLLSKLEFIEDPSNWGSYLQGSIHRISEVDYIIILSAHELQEVLNLSKLKQPRLTDETPIVRVNRKARDNVFRERIREIYNSSCAICGKKRFSKSNNPEVDSAHMYPKEKDGSDDLRNGIALCKLHHWAFDNGLFSIKDDHSIIVENRIKGDSNYREIWCFENRKIKLPKEKEFTPHPVFLKGHRKIHGFAS